jgi:FtsZ-binding cell division protein ZapB
MEDSLRCWLRSTYEEVIDDDHESCEEESESDMIHSLGLYIFTMTDESSFKDVVEEISAHFGRDLTRFIQSSSTFLIEACLICAVSSLSADRTKFVQIIMRMEPAAKAFIMESLKNNLLHYFDPEQSVNETDHGTTQADDRNALSDSHQSTTNRNTEASVVNGNPVGSSDVEKEDNIHNDKRVISFCLSCNDNAIRRAALQEDIESIIKREKEGEIKLRAEITSQTNRLIDAEITIIDMDAKLASKSSELDTALSIIQENEAKIRGYNKVIGQFQLIQDEIDVLKPKADRAEASEQQLEKLRNKLDELKGETNKPNNVMLFKHFCMSLIS